MLTRWGQEGLEASSGRLRLISVVRIVKVHESPDLRLGSAGRRRQWRGRKVYSTNPLVECQNAIGNVGEFKDSQPSVLAASDLVVDYHAKADSHVGGSEAPKTD